MSDTKTLFKKEDYDLGDLAVEGLFTGMLAGLAMAVFLILAELARGEGPVYLLSRFTPSAAGTPVTGVLLHLAIAGIYGAFYAAVWTWLRRRFRQGGSAWLEALAGLVYGSLLYLLAGFLLLPGTGSSLNELPAPEFLAAHLIYGVVLALSIFRAGIHKG
jgi:hypothetical protein